MSVKNNLARDQNNNSISRATGRDGLPSPHEKFMAKTTALASTQNETVQTTTENNEDM